MKYVCIFMSLLLCLISLGILSNSASFTYCFSEVLSITDGIATTFSEPLDRLLSWFGIYQGDNQFSAYFYFRSVLDNSVIPKDFVYYDELQYAVRFPAENFICSAFNRYYVKKRADYVSYIILYFGTDGTFLFGNDDKGIYSPLNDNSVMSIDDWQTMFKGSYFDIEKNTVFIQARGLTLKYEYKFEADGYIRGIWK